jgi:hypothetical protein
MNVTKMVSHMKFCMRKESPVIFGVIGGVGVLATAAISMRAGYRLHEVVQEHPDLRTMSNKDKVRVLAPVIAPTVVASVATIASFGKSADIYQKRGAAATVAYAAADRALTEYRERTVETIGGKKADAISDLVAKRKVESNPPKANNIAIVDDGSAKVLVLESYTGRYFRSTMEDLRKAENAINHTINHDLYATLSEFYAHIGLSSTAVSDNLGWNSDRLLELRFTTAIHDGTPCIVFEYNYVQQV